MNDDNTTTTTAEPGKPAGPVTYTLLLPVELKAKDGKVVQTLYELTLDRIQGKAVRACMNAMEKGRGDFGFELVCASARIPPSTFDQIDAEDVINLIELATPFFKSGPATS